MEEKALVKKEQLDFVTLYQKDGMKKVLFEIKAKADSFVPDISTPTGRKEIASFCYKIARSKTLLDEIGKRVVAEWKAKAKEVDKIRKEARDFCDALKKQVRKPLDEWEAEQKRKEEEAKRAMEEKNKARIDALLQYGRSASYAEVSVMSDDGFKAVLRAAKVEYEETKRKEAEEKAAREAEAKRLAEGRERLAKMQAEAEEQARKIAEERTALEEEKRKEQERRARKQFEREAKERAEREAKEEAERKERERQARERAKAEEKARREAMRPDKEKLVRYIEALMSLPEPELKTKEMLNKLKLIRETLNDFLEIAKAL